MPDGLTGSVFTSCSGYDSMSWPCGPYDSVDSTVWPSGLNGSVDSVAWTLAQHSGCSLVTVLEFQRSQAEAPADSVSGLGSCCRWVVPAEAGECREVSHSAHRHKCTLRTLLLEALSPGERTQLWTGGHSFCLCHRPRRGRVWGGL